MDDQRIAPSGEVMGVRMSGIERGEIAPVWLAFPDINPEIFPRPTEWNNYSHAWNEWYLSLSPLERRNYEARYPEPPYWEGFYRFISNEPL